MDTSFLSLPGFQDWVVTLCQFASGFAVAASLFKVNAGSGATGNDENAEKLIDTRLFVNVGATILLSTTTFVLLPWVCTRCWCTIKLQILYHPNFQATMQVYKLLVFIASISHFALQVNADGSNAFEVKTGYALLASLILAMCDSVFSLYIVYSTIYGDVAVMSGLNPRPRSGFTLIFFQLWQDVAVLSTGIVEYRRVVLGVVFVEMYVAYCFATNSLTSLNPRYHGYRLFLSTAPPLLTYLSSLISSETFTLMDELSVCAILVVSDVGLALCGMLNQYILLLFSLDSEGTRVVILPAAYVNL